MPHSSSVITNSDRSEAEELLELSELDRNQLIAVYYAKANTDDPRQLTDRGLWYQSQDKHQLAVDDFNVAIKLQAASKDLKLWRARGIALYHLERYVDAVTDFSRAIEINPNDIQSISRRGFAYGKLGELDSAQADRNKVIEVEPTLNHRYFERAEVYRRRGAYELALADIENGFEIDSLNDAKAFPRAKAFALCGDIYSADLQQYDKALVQYAKAIELEPTNADYLSKRDNALQAITAATAHPVTN